MQTEHRAVDPHATESSRACYVAAGADAARAAAAVKAAAEGAPVITEAELNHHVLSPCARTQVAITKQAARVEAQQQATTITEAAQAAGDTTADPAGTTAAQKEAPISRTEAAAQGSLMPTVVNNISTAQQLNAAERLWRCPTCTFDNSPTCSCCGICGARVTPRRGAKRPIVQPLPICVPSKRTRTQSGDASSCAICMEPLHESDCSTTQCGHSFCTL
jgi:hypothetical protein